MGVKITGPKKRARHFIKEWRQHRGLTQEQLGEAIGATAASVSRIESGAQPYSQDSLELIAAALKAEPGDLISHRPGEGPTPLDPIDESMAGLVMAALFERLGGLSETEATVLAQTVLEVAHMPAEQLAGAADRTALARAIAAFELRKVSPLKRQ